MEPRPAFIRTNSNPGSPGLLLFELLTPAERNIIIGGKESVIAKVLGEYSHSQCTFQNSTKYLLLTLGMPADVSSLQQFESIENSKEKLEAILKSWTIFHGSSATLGLLTEQFRNHRSISQKIYEAVKEAETNPGTE